MAGHPRLTFALLVGVTACAPAPRPLEFFPLVGEEHFRCTSAWADVGATKVIAQPLDLRLFVSDVALLRDEVAVPYELEERSTQRSGLALLDFEDGQGTCTAGTGATQFQLLGTPTGPGPFTGVRFRLGADPTRRDKVPPAGAELVDPMGRPRGLTLELSTTRVARWQLHASGDCAEPGCTDAVTLRADGFDPTEKVMFFDVRQLLRGFSIEPDAGCTDAAPCAGLSTAVQGVVQASPYDIGSINHDTHLNH